MIHYKLRIIKYLANKLHEKMLAGTGDWDIDQRMKVQAAFLLPIINEVTCDEAFHARIEA